MLCCDDLGHESALRAVCCRWRIKQHRDVVSAVCHPRRGEQVLVLTHHGTFKPQQDIDPGAEARLRKELRIGAVLAAAIGKAIVYNGNLAMISQVNPAVEGAQQWIADSQCAAHLDARTNQRLP